MFRTAFAAALTVTIIAAPAFAGPAETFLSGLDGQWKGSGTLQADTDKRPVKVRCSLRNALAGAKLDIKGRCASSAGTRPVRGGLTANGTAVTASSFRLPGAGRLRDVTARLSGNALTITGTVRKGSRSVPTRNTLTRSGDRLTLAVSAQIDGKWQNRGTIALSR